MTTVHEQGENWISCVKGAPDVILKRCRYEMEEDKIVPLTRERRTEIEAEITRMSARALRVLAGAYRELQTGKMPDGKREKRLISTLMRRTSVLMLCERQVMVDSVSIQLILLYDLLIIQQE